MVFYLKQSEVIQDISLSVCTQVAFYTVLRSNKDIRGDPKRLAWVLTLLCALLTTPFSFLYSYQYVWTWNEAANFQSDRTSQFLVTFFIVFLILDMICAKLHYNSQMEYLEGWFHHICYVGFFSYLVIKGYSISVLTTLPLEVPTLVLSLGKVFPSQRNDWLFGSTFFMTRILYHSYLLSKWYNMVSPPVRLWPVTVSTLILHLYWFTMWSFGQIRRMKKTKSN